METQFKENVGKLEKSFELESERVTTAHEKQKKVCQCKLNNKSCLRLFHKFFPMKIFIIDVWKCFIIIISKGHSFFAASQNGCLLRIAL